MLDGFKKQQGKNAREQVDQLEALIATSREERAALTMMLSQTQLHTAKLTTATRALQEDVEALEMRLRTLSDAVTAAEQGIDSRLQALSAEVAQLRALVTAVETPRPMEEPAPHDADAATLRMRVEAVTVQVSDARRKLESVSAIQAKLLPLTAQLTTLKSQIEKGEVMPPRLSF